jgi:hypothetical protein
MDQRAMRRLWRLRREQLVVVAQFKMTDTFSLYTVAQRKPKHDSRHCRRIVICVRLDVTMECGGRCQCKMFAR